MVFEPKKPNKNDLGIQCPFRFSFELGGFKADCIQQQCALWLIFQKACSLQVIARRKY